MENDNVTNDTTPQKTQVDALIITVLGAIVGFGLGRLIDTGYTKLIIENRVPDFTEIPES